MLEKNHSKFQWKFLIKEKKMRKTSENAIGEDAARSQYLMFKQTVDGQRSDMTTKTRRILSTKVRHRRHLALSRADNAHPRFPAGIRSASEFPYLGAFSFIGRFALRSVYTRTDSIGPYFGFPSNLSSSVTSPLFPYH